MEPEHEPLEEEIPMKKPSFSGSMLVFGGVSASGTSSAVILYSLLENAPTLLLTADTFYPRINGSNVKLDDLSNWALPFNS